MKIIIAVLILGASFPVNANESNGGFNNRRAYESQNGYAYERKCFRYEYREQYIPGNSISPGYVKSYNEKVSIPCNSHRKVFSYYQHKTEPQTSYIKYKPYPKCTVSTSGCREQIQHKLRISMID